MRTTISRYQPMHWETTKTPCKDGRGLMEGKVGKRTKRQRRQEQQQHGRQQEKQKGGRTRIKAILPGKKNLHTGVTTDWDTKHKPKHQTRTTKETWLKRSNRSTQTRTTMACEDNIHCLFCTERHGSISWDYHQRDTTTQRQHTPPPQLHTIPNVDHWGKDWAKWVSPHLYSRISLRCSDKQKANFNKNR